GRGSGRGGVDGEVEQRAGGRPGEPIEADQAADVRPRGLPTATSKGALCIVRCSPSRSDTKGQGHQHQECGRTKTLTSPSLALRTGRGFVALSLVIAAARAHRSSRWFAFTGGVAWTTPPWQSLLQPPLGHGSFIPVHAGWAQFAGNGNLPPQGQFTNNPSPSPPPSARACSGTARIPTISRAIARQLQHQDAAVQNRAMLLSYFLRTH